MFFSLNTQYSVLNDGNNNDLTMMMMQSNRAADGDRWEDRISRRLQRITDALNKDVNTGLEYGRLHKTLSSLENEMLSRKDAGIVSLSSVL